MASIPLYANLRVYFCDRKWSPFFDLKVGYNFIVKEYYKKEYYTNSEYCRYSENAFTQGIVLQGALGLQYKSFDFGFTFGTYNFKESYSYYNEHGIVENSHSNNRMDLKLLLTFAYNFQL